MTDERWHYDIIDVFTERPLTGNQLAVFADAAGIPEAALQPLAREIGFAETVFVYPPDEGSDARIRIFTPASEVPFAGHPTLGTAILVATRLGRDRVVLQTGRGPIPVIIERAAGRATRGVMEQPIPAVQLIADPDPILAALGVSQSTLPVTRYDNGIPHVYVILESPAAVATVAPDMAALVRLAHAPGARILGFNVSAGAGLEWKTRMFAPADGVSEDAATGSAAGPLAVHLCRNGMVPWGAEIRIAQGAEMGRPSELLARASGSADDVARVEVGGAAVPVGGGWFNAGLLHGAYGS